MYREEIGYQIIEDDLTPEQRRDNWEISKGMQAVDGLMTSSYAESLAIEYIHGERTTQDFIDSVDDYYRTGANSNPSNEEADKVAARMVAALADMDFTFSPAMLETIHARLFTGVLAPHEAGVFRDKNITKSEPILRGASVTYGDFRSIKHTLDYDFSEERNSRYGWPFAQEDIERIVKFTSAIWQVHPFSEGNTRTVALFLQLYLKSLGIPVNNVLFKEHSDYFRDALVRSNYADIPKGVQPDHSFLIAFFENLLNGAEYDLGAMNLTIAEG